MSLVPGKLYIAPWVIKRPGFRIPDGAPVLVLGFEPLEAYDWDDTGKIYGHSTGWHTITALTGDGVQVEFTVSDAATTYFKPAT